MSNDEFQTLTDDLEAIRKGANLYQQRATETNFYPASSAVIYPALGLAGEAGEVANKAKKILRDCHGVVTDQLRSAILAEVGDVLWYCAAITSDLNCSLGKILIDNVTKLEGRAARGTLGGSGEDR